LDIAKELNSGFDNFGDIFSLLSSRVKFKKIEFDAGNQQSDDYSDYYSSR
jgi:hypothetical protein